MHAVDYKPSSLVERGGLGEMAKLEEFGEDSARQGIQGFRERKKGKTEEETEKKKRKKGDMENLNGKERKKERN
jgi:hypothetical protein